MAGRGGVIPGQGRKSKAQEAGLAEMIDSAISREDWRKVFKKAIEKAHRGDMFAARLILEYRFGRPAQSLKVSGDAASPLSVLIAYATSDDNPADPPSEPKANQTGT